MPGPPLGCSLGLDLALDYEVVSCIVLTINMLLVYVALQYSFKSSPWFIVSCHTQCQTTHEVNNHGNLAKFPLNNLPNTLAPAPLPAMLQPSTKSATSIAFLAHRLHSSSAETR